MHGLIWALGAPRRRVCVFVQMRLDTVILAAGTVRIATPFFSYIVVGGKLQPIRTAQECRDYNQQQNNVWRIREQNRESKSVHCLDGKVVQSESTLRFLVRRRYYVIDNFLHQSIGVIS